LTGSDRTQRHLKCFRDAGRPTRHGENRPKLQIARRYRACLSLYENDSKLPVDVIKLKRTARPRPAHTTPQAGEKLEARCHAEGMRPFDLGHGPLWRLLLVATAAEEHLLVLTQHHLITDGTSIGIFARELAAVYGACVTGARSPLAPLPIQFAEYARWQDAELATERARTLEAWWKKRLAGLSALALPTDRPHPRERSRAGKSHLFCLSKPLGRSLQAPYGSGSG
jgi:hypothetical protein